MASCKDCLKDIADRVLSEFIENGIIYKANEIKTLSYEKQDIQKRIESIDLEVDKYYEEIFSLIKKLEDIKNDN